MSITKDKTMHAPLYRALTRELAKVLGGVYFPPEYDVLAKIEEAFKPHCVKVGEYLGHDLYELTDEENKPYNRCLNLSYYRMQSGNDEVTGYIS